MDIKDKIIRNLEGRVHPVNASVAVHNLGVSLEQGLTVLEELVMDGTVVTKRYPFPGPDGQFRRDQFVVMYRLA